MRAGISATSTEAKACRQSVYDDPAFVALQTRAPMDIRQASLIQLTNNSKITPQEVQLVSQMHAKGLVCRQQMLDQLSVSFPAATSILIEESLALDQNLLDLAQGKQTWGEYLTRSKSLIADAQVRLIQSARQTQVRLDAAHQQELMNRQAALSAMSQSLAATAQVYQTQQIINNMNRPVTTSCAQMGAFTNCTSR